MSPITGQPLQIQQHLQQQQLQQQLQQQHQLQQQLQQQQLHKQEPLTMTGQQFMQVYIHATSLGTSCLSG